MASSVDLSGAIRVDLEAGAVHVADGEKVVVVPTEVLVDLVNAASPAERTNIARKVGTRLGARLSRRAGSSSALLDAGLEHAASLLAAELALMGLGSCNLERWGRALVVHMTGTPALPPDFVVTMLEGALASATGRSLACTLLSTDGGVRSLVGSEKATARVRAWIDGGTSWSDAIGRLQSGAAS
jgi:hypothetical protein